ncbi:hypothetical protein TSA1_31545 [Bradyrhizobium nitroreducens]|uniref:Uncharacterized protein n=1 Tax=Bradyrhizobium nitroreducens TaxID=709803 RepID=A0A2M6UJN4_9BRAD|nr:hypothetical protein TSA1_31545 [Bradyrhizobium nitroreducens]
MPTTVAVLPVPVRTTVVPDCPDTVLPVPFSVTLALIAPAATVTFSLLPFSVTVSPVAFTATLAPLPLIVAVL